MPKQVLFRKLNESFDIQRLHRAASRRSRTGEQRGAVLTSLRKSRSSDITSTNTHGLGDISNSSHPLRQTRSASSKHYVAKVKQQPLKFLDPVMRTELGVKNVWTYLRPNGKISISISYI